MWHTLLGHDIALGRFIADLLRVLDVPQDIALRCFLLNIRFSNLGVRWFSVRWFIPLLSAQS
jgi:hypothetical protein